jgi:hypothetical protein
MVQRYAHHSVERLKAGIGTLEKPIPQNEEKVLQICDNETGI